MVAAVQRRLSTALLVVVAAVAVAPAEAQAPSVRGMWTGSTSEGTGRNTKVRIRYVIRDLRVGKVAGTTRYTTGKRVCEGRLTLRARERGGYVFRDRLVKGSRRNCTSGDRLFLRRSGSRLNARVTLPGDRTVSFTLRRG
jgi:hypothetical protein